MWVQAGFSPETFYPQTPGHFQLAMEGVRRRLENEAKARLVQSYETGAFGGLAHHGKLKRFDHYDRKQKAQTPAEMLAVLRMLGARSDMRIERVKLG